MPLVTCPACQRQISTEAAACPGCGHPQAPAPAPAVLASAAGLPGFSGPEEERWVGTPSVKALLGPILRTTLFAVVIPVAVYLAYRPALERIRFLTSDLATWVARYEEGLRIAAIGFVVTVVGLRLVRLAWQILVLKAHRYRITSHRIGVESGVFSKRIEEIDMRVVEDLEFRQSFLDRLLGIGQITILSGDRSTGRFMLVGVSHPRDVRELIRQSAYAATKGQLFTRTT